ncbi:ABC-F family ATP-binding cassette domain-containing protein [Salisediminibacterium halotolerans]|uniref:ABC-F family ATP-binding cassette domain-containing protein n=1 Tax=Salisediminibacterium halotolerans TaxID=517425 RepID=UPI000EB380CE|nr:ATP-binding cassette domain-containing protein [Salisediminibacterium halotolerans]RLJ81015.1 ATPase subunit of ABC transporter with duplicated ATPase domains [Actinophytocola xinjiangensis]RPE87895.1 ATPase subunit of ABC transporter with duplicated ATPase domains [Salisediminibacterium halotolerans]TWG37908.1 ATPase subunit of ABC transporter with duplicated ATPase domains [Salisediminibacterium halotolerans]GEL08341.1 putative ABC transporter ATP-binding protein YkpA [Salisediminibacteriu
MLDVNKVGLRFGDQKLFEDVNIKFTPGNCYGLIGANGAGKSTFLKILSGEIEPQDGNVHLAKDHRMAVLKQDHFQYENDVVLDVVMMGHERMYEVMQEKNEIYMKPDFSDEDGMKAAELEAEFAEMNGYEAESDAAVLLKGLGVSEDLHSKTLSELTGSDKVKVLLAQALFGNPDVLLLDEPTNNLDIQAIQWLEEFLINFENTVIVVSHDRHFLNHVCTHIADIDYGKIQLYVGNYDFWYESSQLAMKMAQEQNKKKEEKIKDLKEFIARFSANASKSKQATSRKKLLDKIELDDIQPSSRKYPYIAFKPEREIGNDVLEVKNLSKTVNGEKVLDNVSFTIDRDDKVALVGPKEIAKTTLMQILMGEVEPDEGTYKWGITTSQTYFPKDNSPYFEGKDVTLVDWLREYSPEDQTETFIRGFLGRMLFSGEEAKKKAPVLSGGEKVRCMLSKMMLSEANVMLLDEPTNHLDLEAITALNNGLIQFKGVLIFASHDLQFNESIANRIIELKETGVYDKKISYNEYLQEKLQTSS